MARFGDRLGWAPLPALRLSIGSKFEPRIAAVTVRAVERPRIGFDAVVLGARGTLPVRERLASRLVVQARLEEIRSPEASFILSSERAVSRWEYDLMEIGALIDRYAGGQGRLWRGEPRPDASPWVPAEA